MEQKEFNNLRLIRLGKILNNLTIPCLVYMLLTALMPALSFLGFIVVGIVLILSLIPWILSGFQFSLNKVTEWFSPEFLGQILNILNTYLPYVFGASAVLAVASVVILLFDKNDKHIGRIVVAVLAVVVGIVALIMKAAGVSI